MAGVTELHTARTLQAAPSLSVASRWLRWRPPTIARLLTALALGLHALVFRFEAPLGHSIAGGVLLMLAGFAWMAWAWWCFRRARTPLPPTAQPTMLIDEGPYRFGRNPMYLGIAAMMIGLGLAAGVPFMAIAALNFVAIVGAVHIPHEEAQLRRTFG
ncbi:MAG TPA: isoprenylcysteine carboxylmethyltransferase family protein, partial [Burkholderiaceae bacterium]|nr:isoprenylcysteine carboxylmethyltransferase family protein [Burkholderiaceae bacterium]